MAKKELRIAVLYGSVRGERQGIKAAKFIVDQITKRGHSVDFIDPKEYDFPMLDKMYKEFDTGKAPEAIEKVAKILRKADAYVLVSAEYNHSVPPALKNMLDHYMGEGFFKPVGIATYSSGGFAGVRVAMHWQSILPEMGMVVLPSQFAISKVQDSFDEKGNDTTGDYEKRIQKFLDELEWYGHALKVAREKGTPY